MASLLEKVMLSPGSLWSTLENPGDIMFVISTFLAYFLREELELPPPAKPLAMELTTEYGVLLAIFKGMR